MAKAKFISILFCVCIVQVSQVWASFVLTNITSITKTSSASITNFSAITTIPSAITTTLNPIKPQMVCDSIQSELYEVKWSTIINTTKALSDPLCIDENKELVYRSCIDGEWGLEPNCYKIQQKLSECPEGFVVIETLCVMFTEKTTFPPQCPFPDVSPFDLVKTKLLAAQVLPEPVWIPVTRDFSNGLGFIRWIEPTTNYKKEFRTDSYNKITVQEENCAIYNFQDKQSVSVKCSETYHGICAYQRFSLIDNKVCRFYLCHQSDFSSKNTCFCQKDDNSSASVPTAKFLHLYQNSIFTTSDVCNIALQKSSKGKYFWSTPDNEIDYTFWSPDVVFDNIHNYGAYTPKGWILTEKISKCVLVETVYEDPMVQLLLEFDDENQMFTLTVINSLWLQTLNPYDVTCFTDASPYDLLHECTLSVFRADTEVTVITFPTVSLYPGNYWCEAFNFTDLEVIETKKILAPTPAYFEFVAIVKMKYPSVINPLSNEIIQFLNDNVLNMNITTDTGIDYVPRIMRIEEVDEANNTIIFNMHLSSLLELNNNEREIRYNEVYTSLVERFYLEQEYSKDLLNFLNTDFCMGIVTTNSAFSLTWPTTAVGKDTTSEEFCFRADGNLITNLCIGNFIDGAVWSSTLFACKILKKSAISDSLHLILSDSSSITFDDEFKTVTQIEIDRLNALDIYLLAKIYEKYFNTFDTIDVDIFGQLFENILKIDRNVLLESQTVTRSADTFLHVLNTVMRNYQSLYSITKKNFYYNMSLVKTVSVLLVEFVNGEHKFTILQGDWTPDHLIQTFQNFEFAVLLSTELRNQINKTSHVAFSIFHSNVLFGELDSERIVTTVLGFNFEHFNESQFLPGPVSILQKRIASTKKSASCVKWFFDSNTFQDTWIDQTVDSENVSSYHLCNFWNTGYVAVSVELYSNNITSDLESLLESANGLDSDQDRIRSLALISEKHNEFCATDVLLVGKVLAVAKSDSSNDLKSLVDVIDNIHKVNNSVLWQSQEKSKATDLILESVDDIVMNHNSKTEMLLISDTFILFVANLKQANISGLAIFESNNSFTVRVFKGITRIDDIVSSNLLSAVIISAELMQQMNDDSKIIISIFTKDVLFYENQTNTKVASKIFDVILPGIEDFSGPISIYHNVSSSDYDMQCGFWNFATDNQSRSYWKQDSTVDTSSILTKCDFWHTTHFALLIHNDDKYINYAVLEWISMINLGISLAGLVIIFLTAVLFEKWRRNIGNKILLNFSFSIILQTIFFYISGRTQVYPKLVCKITGALLHYSVIAQFSWTLVIAVLQFQRFVKVFGPSTKNLLIKACLCGWLFPILPVVFSLIYTDSYVKIKKLSLCYPSGLGLYLGVWLPACIIFMVNFIIFIYIIYSVVLRHVDQVSYGKHEDKHQWRLFVLLFFMLGLTWSFGFLSNFNVVFIYMFCFTATLQGFVIFLYFIVFNKDTRFMYRRAFNTLCTKKEF